MQKTEDYAGTAVCRFHRAAGIMIHLYLVGVENILSTSIWPSTVPVLVKRVA